MRNRFMLGKSFVLDISFVLGNNFAVCDANGVWQELSVGVRAPAWLIALATTTLHAQRASKDN